MGRLRPEAQRATLRITVPMALMLSAACGDVQGPGQPKTVELARDTTEPVYTVTVPDGKQPWPHHDPSLDQSGYDKMMSDLWVVNNFGLYQGAEEVESLYLHDGLDIAIPNGTKIFAVEAGRVRANLGGNQFYRTLVIEDDDEPGYAWGYTHVNSFVVHPGDRVYQGGILAVVNFSGLEHIHLDRLRLREGGSWDQWTDLIHLQPDTSFLYFDVEPPLFEGRFRYVEDGTDGAFLPSATGEIVVTGDVDIVAGLRDPGQWARSTVPYGGPDTYGDRNAPNRIEYAIHALNGDLLAQATSFDFSTMALPRGSQQESAAQTLSIYQHYQSVKPDPPPIGNYNRKFNFYIVTNTGGVTDGALDPGTRGGAWRTAEQDSSGAPRFPNGEYVVTVYAYDFKGNLATRSDTVRVTN